MDDDSDGTGWNGTGYGGGGLPANEDVTMAAAVASAAGAPDVG